MKVGHTARSMRRIVVLGLLPLVLAAFAAAAGATPATTHDLAAPNALRLASAAGVAAPGRTPVVANLAIRPFASWGGQYLTPAGEPITLRVSDSYPQDPARPQQWANFLGSLEHGTEITKLTLVLAPLGEVQGYCGRNAYACYSSEQQTMVAPGDPPDPTTSVEAIIAHEYGHHLATNRSNPPWTSVEYGTKRWASYQQVCKETAAGQYHPGAEDNHYALNPGEGFAETYRVLNEHRLGLLESSWDVVSRAFYPDAGALAALEQDIISPWTANTVSTTSGRFERRGKATRTASFSTTLDGNVVVTLRTPRTLRARLDLSADGSLVGTVTTSGSAKAARTTICGSRSLTARVTRLAGSGKYSLAFSRP
jgi:hypothetical protein